MAKSIYVRVQVPLSCYKLFFQLLEVVLMSHHSSSLCLWKPSVHVYFCANCIPPTESIPQYIAIINLPRLPDLYYNSTDTATTRWNYTTATKSTELSSSTLSRATSTRLFIYILLEAVQEWPPSLPALTEIVWSPHRDWGVLFSSAASDSCASLQHGCWSLVLLTVLRRCGGSPKKYRNLLSGAWAVGTS